LWHTTIAKSVALGDAVSQLKLRRRRAAEPQETSTYRRTGDRVHRHAQLQGDGKIMGEDETFGGPQPSTPPVWHTGRRGWTLFSRARLLALSARSCATPTAAHMGSRALTPPSGRPSRSRRRRQTWLPAARHERGRRSREQQTEHAHHHPRQPRYLRARAGLQQQSTPSPRPPAVRS